MNVPQTSRLGRLRPTVLARIQPQPQRLPLLEHATAVMDAYMLTQIFQTWSAWTSRVKALKVQRLQKKAVEVLDEWSLCTKALRRLR